MDVYGRYNVRPPSDVSWFKNPSYKPLIPKDIAPSKIDL